ncbi:MAG: metallophosphoesterase family protein [Promethearchaeota archaeon]
MDCLFVHLSDIHVGVSKRGDFLPEKLELCIEEVNDISPEAVFITGDLTMFGFEEEYLMAKKYIDKIKAKTFVVPGNHDARFRGYIYFEEIFFSRNWIQEINGVLIVGLDSSIPDLDEGQIGRGKYNWIKTTLQSVPKDTFKMIVVHHHLVSVPGTGRERSVLTDAGDFLELLVENNVNLVLCGHKHTPHTWKIENMYIVTAGTPSSRKVRAKIPQSYHILNIGDIYTTVTLKEVGGKKETERKCSFI